MPDDAALRTFVATRLARFQKLREAKVADMDAKALLARKNPYLYRYLGFDTTKEMVDALLSAWLSSSDETMFGHALEEIAIYVCQEAYGGTKSSAEGIDLEFNRDGKRHLVSIKSGPSWGNTSQIKKMCADFNRARGTLRQNPAVGEIVAVNGCCYGRTSRRGGHRESGDYYKLCGKEFWELISGDPEMYQKLFAMIAEIADERPQEDDAVLVSPAVKRTTQMIREEYDLPDGTLNWNAVLRELHSKP